MKKNRTLSLPASNDGITMLEVLISMVVLTAGVIGLAPMLAVSIDTNQTSKQHIIASQMATMVLENYEAGDSLPPAGFSSFQANFHDGYDRYLNVYDHSSDSTVPVGLKRVDVQIEWLGDDSLTHSVQQSVLLNQ